MAYATSGLNTLQSASWLRDAVTCPHCKNRPDLSLRNDANSRGEGMVIGCGGEREECMRFPIQSFEKIQSADKLYMVRHEMAKALVQRWNEHHVKTPEYLEGHA